MRFLSVLLVGCFLFLSFTGTIRPSVETAAAKMCCEKMTGKCGHTQKHGESKGCDKQGCPMMFSCSICGFLKVENIRLQTAPVYSLSKPVPLYIIGDLSAYPSSDWKPPKNC